MVGESALCQLKAILQVTYSIAVLLGQSARCLLAADGLPLLAYHAQNCCTYGNIATQAVQPPQCNRCSIDPHAGCRHG